MPTVLTIPAQTLDLGLISFETASDIGAGWTGCDVRMRHINWPFENDLVFWQYIDLSTDSGASWTQISRSDVWDYPMRDLRGNAMDEGRFSFPIAHPELATRRIRVRLNVSKSLQINLTIAVR